MNNKGAKTEVQESPRRSVIAVNFQHKSFTIREIEMPQRESVVLCIEYQFSEQLLETIRQIWETIDTEYEPRIIDHVYDESRIIVYFDAQSCEQAIDTDSRFIGRLASLHTKYHELGFEIDGRTHVFATAKGEVIIPTNFVRRVPNPRILLRLYNGLEGRAAQRLQAGVGLSVLHKFDKELAACISHHRSCYFDANAFGESLAEDPSPLLCALLEGEQCSCKMLLSYLQIAVE